MNVYLVKGLFSFYITSQFSIASLYMVGFEVFRSNVVESMSDSPRILEEVSELRKPLSDLARRIINWLVCALSRPACIGVFDVDL